MVVIRHGELHQTNTHFAALAGDAVKMNMNNVCESMIGLLFGGDPNPPSFPAAPPTPALGLPLFYEAPPTGSNDDPLPDRPRVSVPPRALSYAQVVASRPVAPLERGVPSSPSPPSPSIPHPASAPVAPLPACIPSSPSPPSPSPTLLGLASDAPQSCGIPTAPTAPTAFVPHPRSSRPHSLSLSPPVLPSIRPPLPDAPLPSQTVIPDACLQPKSTSPRMEGNSHLRRHKRCVPSPCFPLEVTRVDETPSPTQTPLLSTSTARSFRAPIPVSPMPPPAIHPSKGGTRRALLSRITAAVSRRANIPAATIDLTRSPTPPAFEHQPSTKPTTSPPINNTSAFSLSPQHPPASDRSPITLSDSDLAHVDSAQPDPAVPAEASSSPILQMMASLTAQLAEQGRTIVGLQQRLSQVNSTSWQVRLSNVQICIGCSAWFIKPLYHSLQVPIRDVITLFMYSHEKVTYSVYPLSHHLRSEVQLHVMPENQHEFNARWTERHTHVSKTFTRRRNKKLQLTRDEFARLAGLPAREQWDEVYGPVEALSRKQHFMRALKSCYEHNWGMFQRS